MEQDCDHGRAAAISYTEKAKSPVVRSVRNKTNSSLPDTIIYCHLYPIHKPFTQPIACWHPSPSSMAILMHEKLRARLMELWSDSDIIAWRIREARLFVAAVRVQKMEDERERRCSLRKGKPLVLLLNVKLWEKRLHLINGCASWCLWLLWWRPCSLYCQGHCVPCSVTHCCQNLDQRMRCTVIFPQSCWQTRPVSPCSRNGTFNDQKRIKKKTPQPSSPQYKTQDFNLLRFSIYNYSTA